MLHSIKKIKTMNETKEKANKSKPVFIAYILLAIAGVAVSILKLFQGSTPLAVKSIGIMLVGVVIVAIINAILKNNKDLIIVSRILLYAFTAFILFSIFCLATGIPEKFYCGPLKKMIGITNCDANNKVVPLKVTKIIKPDYRPKDPILNKKKAE